MDKVSVIIPSFNRFKYLLNAIESIKTQTYQNLEIIVINDKSTQEEYYSYDWEKNDIIIIHLEESSRHTFGYPCVGFVRNQGIEKSTGNYIAFCDDDDVWFPKKIALQLDAMKRSNCKMSATDGLYGRGVYNPNKIYKRYNAQHYLKTLKRIYTRAGSDMLDNGFPEIWTLDFLKIHNCIINSSVIVEKDILIKAGMVPFIRRAQDYRCWLNVLKYTDCVYLEDSCVYYDAKHGNGSNH